MTNSEPGRFDGRVAIVTGAARGMGGAVAHYFLKAGAKVACWDVSSDGLAQQFGGLGDQSGVQTAAVDISDEQAVMKAAADVVDRFGRIDILVNAAGIAGVNAPVETFPADVWRQVLDVNLTGTFLCCKAVVPTMRSTGYGRIVNIASVAGKEGNPNASAYSASKAGVIALTRSLGKELAAENITVNAITPAVIKTEMLDDVTPAQIDYMLSKIPMRRMGKVDEIANMVAFLSGDGATFSTAAVFDMSGGRTTY